MGRLLYLGLAEERDLIDAGWDNPEPSVILRRKVTRQMRKSCNLIFGKAAELTLLSLACQLK